MENVDPGPPPRRPCWGMGLQLALVACAWVFLYRETLPMLLSLWGSDDFSYCYLVPVAAGYFAWKSRKRILTQAGGSPVPGLVLLVFSGGVFLVGRLGALETLLYVSMWLSIAAIALIYLGQRAFAALLFPLAVLAFIVPPPALIERILSFNLRLLSSSMAAHLLQLIGIPVYLEGNILDIGTMRLQVVDACSGLRYLLPTIFLSLIVSHSMLKRAWTRGLLVASAIPVSIALNSIRLVVTAVLARYVSPRFVEGFLHDLQGWAIYLVTIGALAGAGLLLRRLEGSRPEALPTDSAPDGNGLRGAALAGVDRFTTIYTIVILVSLTFSVSAYAKDQIVPDCPPLEGFPLEIGTWKGTREYLDKATLDSLWADDYHLGTYVNSETGRIVYLFVPYYKQQTAQHTAHAPTSCLLGSGWEIRTRKILPPRPDTGRDFSVQQLVLGKGGEQLLSNFWFQQRGRIIVGEFENKFFLLADSVARRRTDGALVRVEILLRPNESIESAQKELDGFVSLTKRAADGFIPR